MSNTATVFVVDDDRQVRQALKTLLSSVGMSVSTYATTQAFLDVYDASQPGCLVLDVRMPGQSGLDLQEHLLSRSIEIPIVFVTGHGDVPMSVKAMKAGAVDFLEKPFNDQELLDAVTRGIEQDRLNRLQAAETEGARRRLGLLTPRESDVLELVVAGHANKNVAAELGISEKTVKVHRGRVMQKAGATSVAELVRLWTLAGR